ncbi:MAG: class II aldolase/adducin family protein [Polyangia bacterium]
MSGMNDDLASRHAVVDHARRMNALGINQGKSGNVSIRARSAATTGDSSGFLITPSGLPYETMSADDIVLVRWDGSYQAADGREPSSEWRLHRDIYQARPEAVAIIHAHAMFATTLACLDTAIPAFHYMVAVAGGVDIRCAPYATFGTQELSDAAVRALDGRRACLHSHHGMTVFGRGLPETLALAVEVETLAAMYWRALQLGSPSLLSAEQMSEVLDRFRDYGQPRGGPG